MTLSLYPFQKEGVSRLHQLKGIALLADDMGLGKTIQVLKYLEECDWPLTCVVCPASLRLQWQREAREKFGVEFTILSGTNPSNLSFLKKQGLFLISYDVLHRWLNFLLSLKLRCVVADESHNIGSLKAQRTQAFIALAEKVPKRIIVSGTPLTNRPWELYPSLHVLMPKRFDNPYSFGHTYCEPYKEFGHWQFNGARNLSHLHKILKQRCMIRRLKSEVLDQLPPLTWGVVPLEIENVKEYRHAERDLIGWLATFSLDRAMRAMYSERYVRLCYLKQLAARLKLPAVFKWFDNRLASSDAKILAGCIHRKETPIMGMLWERYKDCAMQIHGGMTQRARQTALDRFRGSKDCRLLFGQIRACGEGLNMPEASQVDFVELPWTPGVCQQFTMRAHRMTTKHAVEAHYLVGEGTIEEDLCSIIQRKQGILDQVLDGVKVQDTSLTIFDELHRVLEERRRTR